MYASGYFGVSLLSGLFMLWANYRYGQLFTGTQKTLVGVALLIARFVDAPVDPLVGWWSDRTRSPWGRRRPFIAYGAIPLVALFVLVWTPPAGANSLANIAWLLGIGSAFFIVFSIVVNPYMAMLPEIAKSPEDRVVVSALVAGFGLAAQLTAMVGGSLLAGQAHSFTLVVWLVAGIALVALLLPLLVRGSASSDKPPTAELRLLAALTQTLANRPFRLFLLSKCLYWVAAHSVLSVVPFLVRGVLGSTEESVVQTQTGLLLAFAAAPAFLWFAALKWLAKRLSKRQLSLMGLATLCGLALCLSAVGAIPGDPRLNARVLMILASFPVAVLFSVPTAIIAEIVDLDEHITGMRREAMFFGAQGFFVKAAWGASSIVVMAAQGIFYRHPALAVRATLVAVALLAALAFAVFRRFPEDAELRQMATSEPIEP